jgi:hypothetical protein
MTITVSSFGNNSKCLAIDNATANQVMDSIAAQVTAAGYELWDTVTTGSPYRVFRNLCSDGVTYKYIVFAFSGSWSIQLYLYSAWNNSTHAGTNPAWGTANTPYADTGISNVTVSSNLYLVIAPRFIAIGVTSSTNGAASCAFVTEFANDNPLDTPVAGKVPAFLSWNPIASTGSSSVGGVTMDMNGVTGQSAFNNSAGIVASNGIFGPTTSMGFYMNFQYANKNPIASDGVFYNSLNTEAAQLRGRIYGLKILPKYFGTFGSVVSLKVDSNGFLDPNGTPTDHLIFSGYAFPM